jgi:hypothetical protein
VTKKISGNGKTPEDKTMGYKKQRSWSFSKEKNETLMWEHF